MTDPSDRKATGRDALEAESASDVISNHVKRGRRKRARSGQRAGPRPYGYTRRFDPVPGESIGQVIAWDEEKVIRRIVRWCLEVKPLSWIAAQLNACGVPCPRNRLWDVRLVRRLVDEHQHASEWDRFLAQLDPEFASRASKPEASRSEMPRAWSQAQSGQVMSLVGGRGSVSLIRSLRSPCRIRRAVGLASGPCLPTTVHLSDIP